MCAPSILLVDDEPRVLRYLKTVLEIDSYEVETAASGEEALQRVRHGPAPSLVLLDLLMPRRDGLSVLAELRRDVATRAIPVVIMSNSSKDLERQKASTLGVVDYWIKSNLSLQELCDRVSQLLRAET